MGFVKRNIEIESYCYEHGFKFALLSDQEYKIIQNNLRLYLDPEDIAVSNIRSAAFELLKSKSPFNAYLINTEDQRKCFGYHVIGLFVEDTKLFKHENMVVIEEDFHFMSSINLMHEVFIERK